MQSPIIKHLKIKRKINCKLKNTMLKTGIEITRWLHQMNITHYTLNDDLSVNSMLVNLSHKQLKEIPVQFNEVAHFYCEENKLTSLKGCPKIVHESFKCRNNLLTTLEYSPNYIGKSFYCDANKLTSLKGGPKIIGNVFSCQENLLTSLEFCPDEVRGNFYCDHNFIEDFSHAPKSIGKGLFARNNPIKNFEELLNFNISNEVVHEIKNKNDIPVGFENFYTFDEDHSVFVMNLRMADIKSIILFNSINQTATANKSNKDKKKNKL